jgi:hypothetical protein
MKIKKPWGIWVKTSKEFMEDNQCKKARYQFRREAVKDAEDFNNMWRGRPDIYEARKI